jgi:hypothetical protein
LAGKKKHLNRPKAAVNMEAHDLWIAPKSNLKGDGGDRAWNDRSTIPTGSRLLELADIALGLKKREPPQKRRSAAAANGSGQE